MDSVSEKQGFLSMTGIDKAEENSDAIDKLHSDISDFMKNQVPFFGVISNLPQTIQGVKTFTNPIVGCGIDPIDSNPIVFNSRGKYKLVIDSKNGTTIFGALNIDNNTLSIDKVVGLRETLNNPPTIPEQYISGSQLKLFTVMGANLALESIEDFNLKKATVTGAKIASKTITGENLASDISFVSSGGISVSRFTSDFLTTNFFSGGNISADGYFYKDSFTLSPVPQLHICIPFVPLINDSAAASNISFFVQNVSVSINPMLRYRHPVAYKIHSISVLYNTESISNSASINLFSYDSGGNGTGVILGTATLSSNAGISCDTYTFPKAILVPKTASIGGSHKYSAAADKQATYILWGYQVSNS